MLAVHNPKQIALPNNQKTHPHKNTLTLPTVIAKTCSTKREDNIFIINFTEYQIERHIGERIAMKITKNDACDMIERGIYE